MNDSSATTVGMDLGDRYSFLCFLGEGTEVVSEGRTRTTEVAIRGNFEQLPSCRIALEVGTHSPWVSRLLAELGHEVFVANPREVRAIYQSKRKNDRADAEMLARIARVDPKLLKPITHRSAQAQADLAVLHSRDILVGTRTKLVNHVRGTVKALGARLSGCSTECFHRRAPEQLPEALRETLMPILEQIAMLTAQIRSYDRRIEAIAEQQYPETAALVQVRGVGSLTALAYVLVLQDPKRFTKSRQVGAFLGLVPGQDQSGQCDRPRRITKAGDPFLRRLLVHAAHYILGPFGQDCLLRRHGERIAQHGGKNGKRRAVVAVARKLSVLLHRLWTTGEEYEPLRGQEAVA